MDRPLRPLGVAQVPGRRELRHHPRRRALRLPPGPPRDVPERHRPARRPILNFQTARFDVGNDLPYPLFLPTYTATAWYHKRLPADLQSGGLQAAVAEAERFALGDYTLALMQGSRLAPEPRRDIAAKARPLHRPVAGVPRADQPAAGDPGLRQGAAARPAPDRRTARQPLSGDRPRRRRREQRVRPQLRRHPGPVHRHVQRLRAPTSSASRATCRTRSSPTGCGRGASAKRATASSTSPRTCAAPWPRTPRYGCSWPRGYYDLATPFFAAEYTFDHLGFEPDYLAAGDQGRVPGGAHDVRPQGRPREAQGRHRGVLPGRGRGLSAMKESHRFRTFRHRRPCAILPA